MDLKPLSTLRKHADSIESSALASIAIFTLRREKVQGVDREQAFADLQREAGGFLPLVSQQIRAEAKKEGVEITLQAAELRAVHLMRQSINDRAAFLKVEAAANIGERTDLYREPVARWVENDRAGAQSFLLHAEAVEGYLKKNLTAGDRGKLEEVSELHRSLYSIEAIRSTVATTLEATRERDQSREMAR